ncbi:MAG: hypothetical protein J6Z11_08460 [Candidatus Riflebacteria bacterium]|nr:hypothetical protein [Candidatus Riflebacteria bacterium]
MCSFIFIIILYSTLVIALNALYISTSTALMLLLDFIVFPAILLFIIVLMPTIRDSEGPRINENQQKGIDSYLLPRRKKTSKKSNKKIKITNQNKIEQFILYGSSKIKSELKEIEKSNNKQYSSPDKTVSTFNIDVDDILEKIKPADNSKNLQEEEIKSINDETEISEEKQNIIENISEKQTSHIETKEPALESISNLSVPDLSSIGSNSITTPTLSTMPSILSDTNISSPTKVAINPISTSVPTLSTSPSVSLLDSTNQNKTKNNSSLDLTKSINIGTSPIVPTFIEAPKLFGQENEKRKDND